MHHLAELKHLIALTKPLKQVEVEHALVQGTISYEQAMEFIDEMMYRCGLKQLVYATLSY